MVPSRSQLQKEGGEPGGALLGSACMCKSEHIACFRNNVFTHKIINKWRPDIHHEPRRHCQGLLNAPCSLPLCTPPTPHLICPSYHWAEGCAIEASQPKTQEHTCDRKMLGFFKPVAAREHSLGRAQECLDEGGLEKPLHGLAWHWMVPKRTVEAGPVWILSSLQNLASDHPDLGGWRMKAGPDCHW